MNSGEISELTPGIPAWTIIKRTVLFFLPAIVLLSSIMAVSYVREGKSSRKILRLKEARRLQTVEEVINSYIHAISSDILIISNHYELQMLLRKNTPENLKVLGNEFRDFSFIKKIYDQIRYLDENGMEIIRINYDDGKADIVPADRLQPKGNRYYFKDAFRLNKGQVYISPFDLNIEHGKIELPIKPMIRFGTPVFDRQGKKRGIVLLNYLGSDLLQKIRTLTAGETGEIYLVNPEGYFLYSPDPEDDWGFMYENKKDRTFFNRFSGVWGEIRQNEGGQISGNDGIFTYRTIRPLVKAYLSSTGSGEPFKPSKEMLEGRDYYWKIVSRLTPEQLNIRSAESLAGSYSIYIVMFFILLTGSFFLARIGEKRKLAEKYKDIVSSSTDMMALLDTRFMYLAVNKAYADAFNMSFKQIIEKRVADVYGEDAFNTAIKPYGDRCLKGEEVNYESWFDFPAYGRCYMNTFYYPYYSDDKKLTGFVVNKRNITERKKIEDALEKSERKYRNMMESFSDPIYICSPQKKIEYMNQAMADRIGRDATGEMCFSAINRQDTICDWCVYDKVENGQITESEIISPLDNRNYFIIHMPINNEDGTVSKMAVYRDITDYLVAVSEKEKAESRLAQSQKMDSIGNLAGGIAHDFNNMLSIILGYGEELLYSMNPEDPAYESVKEIVDAGKRSADLTRQFLAFSRRQVLQPKVADLNSIVLNIEKMLRRLIGEDIELGTFLAGDLAHVKVDPGQVEQVIVNLAVNSRDAMPEGGKLRIETANIVLGEHDADALDGISPGEYVTLSITDNGRGMDEETRKRVFEPFYTTKEKGKGTGLGLSTVYGIVKQSGGYVYIDSEPEHGTTVKIYFQKTTGALPDEKESAGIDSINGKNELILVAEDESSMRKYCEKILTNLNYRVTIVKNGAEALKLIEENKIRPDLVITDVVMPGMSGKNLLDRLKESLPDLKVLFMSGYMDNSVVNQNIPDSGMPFIQKPFTKDELGKMLRRLLDRQRR